MPNHMPQVPFLPRRLLMVLCLGTACTTPAPQTVTPDPSPAAAAASTPRTRCEAARPRWLAHWQATVREAVESVSPDHKAIIAERGAAEIRLQDAAFVDLCAKRDGPELACLERFPDGRDEAACKAAVKAIERELGAAIDRGIGQAAH